MSTARGEGAAANETTATKVLALSGGVGGAKLAYGLAQCLSAEALAVVANTADDFQHLGLPISPDLDSVMYALAGLNDEARGWGIRDESWQMMAALNALGGETWFQLGDRDLATHLQRKTLLDGGKSLSEATAALCTSLGVNCRVLPMSDQPVSTQVHCEHEGRAQTLSFQEYFVREQCAPAVQGFAFAGLEHAQPQAELMAILQSPELERVVICPSNPFVSVAPILQLPGVAAAIRESRARCIAVSPIVGGEAIKGPAAKMMRELNMPSTAEAVIAHYEQAYPGLVDHWVIDDRDAHYADSIETCTLSVTDTIMHSPERRREVAEHVLAVAH